MPCNFVIMFVASVNFFVLDSGFVLNFFLFVLPGSSAGSKPVNQGSLTILGLHLTMLPFKKMSFFSDKREVQRSATALGYVAHVCSFSLLDINLTLSPSTILDHLQSTLLYLMNLCIHLVWT